MVSINNAKYGFSMCMMLVSNNAKNRCYLIFVKLLVSSWEKNIIYEQFEGIVYKQIFGVPMDTNCAPRKADFFVMRGILCLTFTNLNSMTLCTC